MNDNAGRIVYPAEYVLSELKAELRGGQWSPGAQFPTELALTKRYGLCRATVNKILKTLEKEGLLAGGPGRGRFVCEYSRRKTGVIEVILSDEDSIPRFLPLIDAMREALAAAGYHLRLTSLNHTWDQPQISQTAAHLNLIDPEAFDGCVVLTQAVQLETVLLLARRKPLVWFNHPSYGPRIAGVRFDFAGGAFAAVRHLLELGHRRLGWVGVHERYVSGREQLLGGRLALQSRPDDSAEFQVELGEDFLPATGYALTQRLLTAPNRPTAIVYALDPYLSGALPALTEAGLSIPKDLSLIGWNDQLSPGETPVPLTTLSVDFALAGRLAVAQCLSLIDGQNEELPTAQIPVPLVVRQSTARKL